MINSLNKSLERLVTLTPVVRNLSHRKTQTLWTFADQFMMSGFNFVIGIIAAWLLDLPTFGLFALLLMLANLSQVIQEAFLSMPMMTLAGRRTRRTHKYFTAVAQSGFLLALASGLLLIACVELMFYFRTDSTTVSVLFAVFFVTFGQNLHGTIRKILFAERQSSKAFTLDFVRNILLVSGLAAIYFSDVQATIELIFLVLGGSALLATLPVFGEYFTHLTSKASFKHLIYRHWPIASWIVLMVIVSMGQEQAFWIMLGIVLGDEAVGGMRIGQYLLGTTHFIMMAVENFVPRTASEVFAHKNWVELRHYLTRQTFLLGSATLAFILLIAIPAEFWLGLFFGADKVQYADILRLFALSYAVIFIRDLWMIHLRTTNHAQIIFYAFATSSVFALALAYPVMTNFGIYGAAWLLFAAHSISMLIVLYFCFTNEKKYNHENQSAAVKQA